MTDAELAAERLAALLDAERENTALRAEVSYLRACVPPTRPTDYGHEVWTAALVEAKKEGARSAVAEVERLRSEVAWLRSPILPDEPCATCGHAKRAHHDYRRGSDDLDVTKCWGGGFDRDDCHARCVRFVRHPHHREEGA
jgi:hypothetical protein